MACACLDTSLLEFYKKKKALKQGLCKEKT